MKWCHVLSSKLSGLPASLQEASINYKGWKRLTKTGFTQKMIRQLETECKRVDAVFKSSYNRLGACCFTSCSKDDLKLFVELNKTSVYKLCKRIDKKVSPCPGARCWLQTAMSSHAYQFMGGWRATSLFVHLPAECPLCMDRVENIAISVCGHFMCMQCLFSFYKLERYNGMLHNVISHVENLAASRCPICREPRPYSRVHLLPECKVFVKKTI